MPSLPWGLARFCPTTVPTCHRVQPTAHAALAALSDDRGTKRSAIHLGRGPSYPPVGQRMGAAQRSSPRGATAEAPSLGFGA